MGAVAFLEQRVLFSPTIAPDTNRILQAAVAASRVDRSEAETLFRQALRTDPACLEAYYALYKFYFYGARLAEAEQVAIMGLEESARQGRFPGDWRRLGRDTARRAPGDGEALRFYLYTLKALAFIKLRRGQAAEAQAILSKLRDLDPDDRSGASVIMALAAALEDDVHG